MRGPTETGSIPGSAAFSTEEAAGPAGEVPLWVNTSWRERFPWVFAGITGRGESDDPFDLALHGEGPGRRVLERWRKLARATGFARLAHAGQVHGTRVLLHREGPAGLFVGFGWDGHLTRTPDLLLAVSVADCVPVYLLSDDPRAVALLHAGWRGVAAGILEEGVATLEERLLIPAGGLHLHLGPAICGDCYEVGPEVHEALGLPVPESPEPVDLRASLAGRAVAAGIPEDHISVSAHCTRCDRAGAGRPFFSHRAGEAERQMALLGIRAHTGQGR